MHSQLFGEYTTLILYYVIQIMALVILQNDY